MSFSTCPLLSSLNKAELTTIFFHSLRIKGEFTRLITPEQLKALDHEFTSERKSWQKSSLFLSTPLEANESQQITQRLFSHRISLKRTAWDQVSVADQIKVKALLDGKPEMVKKAVTQYQFLRSLMKGADEDKFNFFIIGPSWCESSKEYRYLLEYYSKKFPQNQLVLHSVVVDDPQEQIFGSQLLKDLFPFQKTILTIAFRVFWPSKKTGDN